MPDSTVPKESSDRTGFGMLTRLSVMMFFLSAALGIWVVTLGSYVAANTGEAGSGIYSAGFAGYNAAAAAIGGLIAPVIFGWLSDRYFSAERLLAAANVGCAIAAWGMYTCETESEMWFWLIVYFHCNVPCIALANKISFQHLSDIDSDYPWIRVFSALGWIGAGLFVGLGWPWVMGVSIEATRIPFLLGAALCLVNAVYSLTLPKTPPADALEKSHKTRSDRVWWRRGPLLLFLFVSLLACVPTVAYNNFSNAFLNQQNFPGPAALLTLGQAAELLMLLCLPWFLKRMAMGRIVLFGVVAWAIRFALMSISGLEGLTPIAGGLVLLAILVHGPCIVWLFTVGQMYTNRLVDKEHQGAAQGLYAAATYGFGTLLGALMAGVSQQLFLTPNAVVPAPYHWTPFWLVPTAISAFAAFAIVVMLPRETIPTRGKSESNEG